MLFGIDRIVSYLLFVWKCFVIGKFSSLEVEFELVIGVCRLEGVLVKFF